MTSSKTTQCPKCQRRITLGTPCPNCVDLPETKNDAKKSGFSPIISIFAAFALILVLIVGYAMASTTPSSGLENPIIPNMSYTATTIPPTLSPNDLPKQIKYVVETCEVTGEDAGKVATFKAEMRETATGFLTQFQNDDGLFIQDKFPTFGDKSFLLVCIPKEVGPNWMAVFGDKFFTAIGTRPIDPVTAQENKETISSGFWLFAKPSAPKGSNPTSGGNSNINPAVTSTVIINSPTPTMYFTDTPAPTIPPATLTPVVVLAEIVNSFESVSFDDLAYDRGAGTQAWQACDSKSFTLRSLGNGYIEAACPDFNNPIVHIGRVAGLGESYTLTWSGGGGTWFTRGGVISYGNTGGPNYSWTNSLGVQYYSVGMGNVTISPVQQFAPTDTPAPTSLPNIVPTNTSWNPQVGCVQLDWEFIKANAQVIVNEQGDSVLIRRADNKWWGNNNSDRCYTISNIPSVVINLDTGKGGTWTLKTGSTINLTWLDSSYEGNPFIWRISNNVWVGMVDTSN